MRAMSGPSSLARTAAIIAAVVVAIAACGSAATPSPSAPLSPSPLASDGASVAPGASSSSGASPTAGSAAPSPPVGQTDTVWGRIWDEVPASFPVYPGSKTSELGQPATDERTVAGDVDQSTTWYQAALETAGYSTEAVSGPLEDGSMVIDSVGEPPECRVQVRIRPAAEMVIIDIYVGAACPLD